jgi:hypothetical protein
LRRHVLSAFDSGKRCRDQDKQTMQQHGKNMAVSAEFCAVLMCDPAWLRCLKRPGLDFRFHCIQPHVPTSLKKRTCRENAYASSYGMKIATSSAGGCDFEEDIMLYLLAHCPMFACNHTNLVCSLPSQTVPRFEPGVFVAVKCANCGQVFRQAAEELEIRHSPASVQELQQEWQ